MIQIEMGKRETLTRSGAKTEEYSLQVITKKECYGVDMLSLCDIKELGEALLKYAQKEEGGTNG